MAPSFGREPGRTPSITLSWADGNEAHVLRLRAGQLSAVREREYCREFKGRGGCVFEAALTEQKGRHMRLIVLVLTALIASGPAVAQAIAPPWKQYPEPVEGFLLTFPGEPELAYPMWELIPKRPAPASVYSVRYNNGLFKMTVVDAQNTFIKEEPIVARAIEKIAEGGKLLHNEPTRVYQVYGREISVGRPDGSTTLAVLFYVNERLYMVEATGPLRASSDMFLFLRSLSFDSHVRNRTKEQLDAYWASCTRGANGVQLPLIPVRAR
jgi:hypothetical protein